MKKNYYFHEDNSKKAHLSEEKGWPEASVLGSKKSLISGI